MLWIQRLVVPRSKKVGIGLSGAMILILVLVIALQAGVAEAQVSAFTENFTGSSSSYFSFLQQGGGTIASGVADGGAADGRIARLTLPAYAGAGPSSAPNLQSTTLYGFGTYEARIKMANCSSQPNTGVISGFFTYLNDGTDQDGDGVRDNSEIDFEVLCAEPNVIWLTQWTDFQESPLAMKRIYREFDMATGQIRRTCYSEGYGVCTQDLTGSATEGQPASITPIPGFNSATAYYTYGWTWASNRMTWYIYNPSNGQKIILWDYRGPTSRITQRPAYYMMNVWHTNNWPPPSMPNAIESPNTPRTLDVDWMSYNPSTTVGTPVPTPTGPTPTRTRTPTATNTPLSGGGTNLAAGRTATGSIAPSSPARITDGDKNTNNFAGQDQGVQWIRLDLGQSYNVGEVKIWHYFGDGRTYHDVIVQLSNSATFTTKTTVFNNDTNNSAGQGTGTQAEYAETSAGKSITFTPVSSRYVRLWVNGSSANVYNHYVEVEVYAAGGGPTATPVSPNTPTRTPTRTNTPVGPTNTPAPTTNLALNRPSTSSSNESASLTPNLAFDGNGGTRWASQYSDPQWIRVDLGATRSISRIRLSWEAAYGRSYQIQVSNDGSSWTSIYSTTTGNGAIDDLTGLSGSGRYVRMYGTARGTAWGYSLWEFEVYGSGGTVSTATLAPTNTPAPTATTSSSTCYTAWVSTITYATGSRVTYNGINYQANYATNGDNPALHSGPAGSGQPWLTLGPCNPATATAVNTPLPTYTPCPSCPTPTLPAEPILWDDFSYTGPGDALITQRNWILRSVTGGPGVAGATWAGGVTFVNDPANSNNRLMQLNASTDGTAANTRHAEMYHQRKFFEGTYASRVFFTDAPDSGPDGENIVETFFTITPLAADLDPDYGEIDFEYLPNGGWGVTGPIMYLTSWETYQNEPWQAVNTNNNYSQSYAGWHNLVLQVAGGQMKYYIDGTLLATHGGIYYPETPMSINFNLWFITLQGGSTMRTYRQDVDWVFYVAGQVLSPSQVDSRVLSYRVSNVKHIDTVPASGLPGIPNQ